MNGSLAVGEVEQEQVASRALDEGADGAATSCSYDEVSLPVPRDGSILDLGWSLGDHDHVLDAAPRLDVALVLALGAAPPQAAGQLASELASALDIEGLTDGLVAHVHGRIVRMLPRQPPRDLLGRPELFEPGGDLLGQGSVLELGDIRPPCTPSCPLVGVEGPVVLVGRR